MSMTWTSSSLPLYLYGYDHEATRGDGGELIVVPKKIDSHKWGNKKVASGFFNQADSEHVSAVIRNNSGTISKFNRIGVVAGFGSDRVVLIREGSMVDHDPNASEPKSFRVRVERKKYHETWLEGMDVFHNPNTKHPLDPDALPGAAHHHFLSNGQVERSHRRGILWVRSPTYLSVQTSLYRRASDLLSKCSGFKPLLWQSQLSSCFLIDDLDDLVDPLGGLKGRLSVFVDVKDRKANPSKVCTSLDLLLLLGCPTSSASLHIKEHEFSDTPITEPIEDDEVNRPPLRMRMSEGSKGISLT